ncbi:ABC transporter ATP-binding protein [Spiractinospora alimapuensis]|uniref:ABC transporter ATP-binding protein n=1 Tax=Spiractinospora alimapuensis TaxID=2820884 RepID=UPI001F36B4A3|nr:ABC transporter ATP-binding protein [Spiractinospora alimapuensis]QVQ50689.1 ABC transporter ATP-binding protein [Spiractinospora alimapuensis]
MTTQPLDSASSPPTTERPALSVDDLRVRYADFEAVRGISFTVEAGELFALLGTNGAGKTTTIETLEGFRRPHSGVVRVLGQDPFGQPAGLRPFVNAVLQHSGSFPELTVNETVDLARDLAASARERAEVLEMVNLAAKGRTYVRQLSGGEKRRLDLALAILTRPRVLFLDEPTTGMDPEARHTTWELLRRVQREGTTILLTTHYLEEAERLADRLAIMHLGEIVVEGVLQDVLAEWGDRLGFRLPDTLRTDDLPEVPGATVSVEVRSGEPWISYTVLGGDGEDVAARAHRAMSHLIRWADTHNVPLHHLEARSASLEDVFLNVAGSTTLREMGDNA